MGNFRVLTVTTGAERISNMIEAHRRYTRHLCPPNLFLFIDKASIRAMRSSLSVRAPQATCRLVSDLLALAWRNGNDKPAVLDYDPRAASSRQFSATSA